MHVVKKLSLLVAASLAAVAAPVTAQTRPATRPATTAPAPTPTPPPEPASTSAAVTPVVDVPRSGLYAGVMKGNAASDNTVDDYLLRPTLIGGRQFVSAYGAGGTLDNAAFALTGMGYTWFGSFEAGPGGIPGQGSAPDEIRGGLATDAFAAGLMLAIAKSSTDNGAGTATRTTSEADAVGVFGNLKLGSGSDVYGELSVHTDYDPTVGGEDYVESEFGGTTNEDSHTRFHLMAGWKRDATTQGTHALNVQGTFDLGLKSMESTGDTGTLTQFDVVVNHGYILRQTPTFSAFIGATGQVLFLSETRTFGGGPEVDGSHLRFAAAPNFAFQQTLKKGFELFAGGSFILAFDSYENRGPTLALADNERWDFMTTGSDVSLGMRWRYENIAIDASVNEALMFSGPNFISGTVNPMFAQLGLTVGF